MNSSLTTKLNEKNREYFAAQEVDECVSRCVEKIDEYYSEMNRTGRINVYRNSYAKYFQGFILKGALYHSGQEGELTNTWINHYHNLITHQVNMVCQQKLSYEPQATVSDSQAMEQIKRAKGILYLYANRVDTDLDGKLRQATEMSRVFGESYISVLWNKELGRTIAGDFDEQSGQQIDIKEGDNEFLVHTPFDVIVDVTLTSNDLKEWVILRKWENKFSVAAKYPNWADEITGLSMGGSIGETQLTYSIGEESTIIPVYYLVHKKTPAVPDGRLCIFIDDHIILADGDIKYREIPLFRMCSGDLWGSPYGYANSFDALPMQDMVDRLTSAVLTNQLTFATQNILIAKGSDIAWESLYGGLNVIEYPPELGEAGKPSALQLTSSPPETFTFIDKTIQNMGTIMGINEVLKGNPDLALKGAVSAETLALMNSNAIQFNSDLQKAYVRLAEQVGTAILHNIQDFAFPEGLDLKRQGMTMSATNDYHSDQFGKSDIDKIDRIIVRYGNPLSQTTSGRMEIAKTFLEAGKITVDQYFEVMETGSLEPAFEAEESERNLIKEENEALMRGEKVPVLWADNHPIHMQEHKAKISNLEARKNPKVIAAFQDHMSQHQKFMAPPVSTLPPPPTGVRPSLPQPASMNGTEPHPPMPQPAAA